MVNDPLRRLPKSGVGRVGAASPLIDRPRPRVSTSDGRDRDVLMVESSMLVVVERDVLLQDPGFRIPMLASCS